MTAVARRPLVGDRLPPGRRHVHLTFDDGPHPTVTPAVLNLLAAFRVRATFYLLGSKVAAHPTVARAVADAGHEIGNHSQTHPRLGWFDVTAAERDFAACQRVVTAATGRAPMLLRPPFGRVTPAVWLAARRLELTVRTWSLDSRDWQCRGDVDAVRCADSVARIARPRDVLLLHDNHDWIVPILTRLLPELAERKLLQE